MSPISILAENRQNILRVNLPEIKDKARRILETLGCEGCQLSMLVVDDGFMAQLNEEYRGVEGSTDVLSFPQGEPEFPQVEPRLLGDVVISAEVAKRQAEAAGHSLEKEMDLLLVHGVLHLLGYEHETSALKAREMQAREREVLKALEG